MLFAWGGTLIAVYVFVGPGVRRCGGRVKAAPGLASGGRAAKSGLSTCWRFALEQVSLREPTPLTPRTVLLPLALLLLASGCQGYKARGACDNDVDRLQGAIRDTTIYLDALRPELRAGFAELLDCDRISETCDAETWLLRAQTMQRAHQDVRTRFARAVELWSPDACVPHLQNYTLSPPDPATWRGYFFTLDQTGEQIDELVDRFGRRAG